MFPLLPSCWLCLCVLASLKYRKREPYLSVGHGPFKVRLFGPHVSDTSQPSAPRTNQPTNRPTDRPTSRPTNRPTRQAGRQSEEQPQQEWWQKQTQDDIGVKYRNVKLTEATASEKEWNQAEHPQQATFKPTFEPTANNDAHISDESPFPKPSLICVLLATQSRQPMRGWIRRSMQRKRTIPVEFVERNSNAAPEGDRRRSPGRVDSRVVAVVVVVALNFERS